MPLSDAQRRVLEDMDNTYDVRLSVPGFAEPHEIVGKGAALISRTIDQLPEGWRVVRITVSTENSAALRDAGEEKA